MCLLGSNLDPPMLVVPVLFLALDEEKFGACLLELVVVFGNKLAPSFHFLAAVYLSFLRDCLPTTQEIGASCGAGSPHWAP